jgi:DNA-binding beta-propeller fold protein YncE
LAVDTAGNLFIAEYLNNRVRKVTPEGIITTVAGSSQCCDLGDGGQATSAYIPMPHGIALDAGGNLYVTEWPDSRIRKVTPSGMISTYAGAGTRGFSGDGGPATQAQLNCPWGLALDEAGNLYVADNQNLRVREITRDGMITTIAGGPTSALPVDNPTGITVDASGNVVTSGGWIISSSGRQSVINVRSRDTPVNVSGVGIGSDVRGNLYVVAGNAVLKLDAVYLRRPSH